MQKYRRYTEGFQKKTKMKQNSKIRAVKASCFGNIKSHGHLMSIVVGYILGKSQIGGVCFNTTRWLRWK